MQELHRKVSQEPSQWTPAQAVTLRTALDGAIPVKKNAKAHTDKNPWDDAAQERGTTFLANASKATLRPRLGKTSTAPSSLAQRVKNIGDNIFQGDPNAPGLPPLQRW